MQRISSYSSTPPKKTISTSMTTTPSAGTTCTLPSHSDLSVTILKNIYDGRSSKAFLVLIHSSIYILKLSLRSYDDIQAEKTILDRLSSYYFEPVLVFFTNKVYRGAVMHYVGLPLRDVKDIIPRRDLFYKVMTALKELHDNHVLHQDIKPQNILYNEFTTDVTIIDFGYSAIFEEGKTVKQAGYTIDYVSPYHLWDELDPSITPYGYRKVDDILSVFYTFCDLEDKNPYKYVSKALKRVDERFLKKYKNRSIASFKKFKPKTVSEVLYVEMCTPKKKACVWDDISETDEERWIRGEPVDDIMNKCIKYGSILYKLKYLTFDTIPYLHECSKKFKNVLTNISSTQCNVNDPMYTGLKEN
jgi:serine/threonine protein kinase